MQVLELLTKAQDLIRDPTKWTRGYYSRDAAGEGLGEDGGSPEDAQLPEAVCFCSLGALFHYGMGLEVNREAEIILGRAVTALDKARSGVIEFNDTHTHEEVMLLWDKAREIASASAA